MTNIEKAIQQVKDMKEMFRELLDAGTTPAEFKSAIDDLNLIQSTGSRVLVKLIQSHLDSLSA